MVHEALGAKACEEALGHPLLQVQVDGVVAEHVGVLEDHRPDGRLAPPVGQPLVPPVARRLQLFLGDLSVRAGPAPPAGSGSS